MRCKADRGLATLHDPVVALLGLRRVGDEICGLVAETFDGKFVKMCEFDGNAAEIVPHATENVFDLGVRLFRKSGPQLFAADPVLLEQRSDLAHEGAGEISHPPPIGVFYAVEQTNRERADSFVEQVLERRTGHQNMTMILPNTCRLSSLASPRSNSSTGTSLSITGRRPDAILATLSPILRSEQPNEPKIRYCCR